MQTIIVTQMRSHGGLDSGGGMRTVRKWMSLGSVLEEKWIRLADGLKVTVGMK